MKFNAELKQWCAFTYNVFTYIQQKNFFVQGICIVKIQTFLESPSNVVKNRPNLCSHLHSAMLWSPSEEAQSGCVLTVAPNITWQILFAMHSLLILHIACYLLVPILQDKNCAF